MFKKAQRNEVYKLAKTYIENRSESFLCLAIDEAVYDLYRIYYIDVLESFPEFANFAPKNVSECQIWWAEDDKQSRYDCMGKCIELTNPKTKAK